MNWLLILLVSVLAMQQNSTIGGASGSGTTVIGTGSGSGFSVINGGVNGLPSANAALPLFWATSQIDPIYSVTKTLGVDYPCATPAQCFASAQQEICDYAFSGLDQAWHAINPHGTLIQTGTSVTCSQTGATTYRTLTLLPKIIGGVLATQPMVFDSDTPLTESRTVCSGAVDDTAVLRPPTGDISTWWTGSNYGCNPDRASMWVLEGNWNPGNVGMLIQAGSWDVGTNLGPANYVFKNAEFRPIQSNTNSVFVVSTAIGGAFANPTLLSQTPSNIHFINVYGHGDGQAWCAIATGTSPCNTSASLGGPRNNNISTFLRLTDCRNCSVTYSYFDWIIKAGGENHVIGFDRSSGPLHISQNFCSGASSCIFGGGVSATDPLYAIADVQVTSNRLTNPISWVGPNYGGVHLTLKNRLEFKAGQRLVIEGNIAEWSDTSGGQDGQCWTLTPRNTSGGALGDNYSAPLQDVTIRYNICRHALVALESSATSSYSTGNGGGTGPPADHWTIEKNLAYDLGSAFFDQTRGISFPYFIRSTAGAAGFVCSGVNVAGIVTLTCDGSVIGLHQTNIRPGDGFTVTNCSTANWNLPAVSTNVWQFQTGAVALAGTLPAGLTIIYANPSATGSTATNCVVQARGAPYHQLVQHNTVIMQSDVYPYSTSSGPTQTPVNGTASITAGVATVTVTNKPIVIPNVGKVTVIGASINAYNCTNCLVTATTTIAPFTVTYITGGSTTRGPEALVTGIPMHQPGNQADIYSGQNYQVFTDTGCSGAGPNNSTAISAISRTGNMVTATVGSLVGWPAAVGASQILVEVSGVTPASFNGVFYYQGQSGGNVTWSQVAADDTGTVFGTAAQMGSCPANPFLVGNTFKNNLLVVDEGGAPSCPTGSKGWAGWLMSGGVNVEGCPTGPANACSENSLDVLTSTVTNTDFPGRCLATYKEFTGGTAISPLTLTFPKTSVCPGATGNSDCVGMKSMMNGVPFDANNADYHNYVLDPTSVYKNAGDDGLDLGIGSLTGIDNAIHSHQYVCVSYCGTGGPFPD